MPEQPIRLGGGHCCVCAATCNHIGPIRLCAMHLQLESRGYAAPCPCEVERRRRDQEYRRAPGGCTSYGAGPIDPSIRAHF